MASRLATANPKAGALEALRLRRDVAAMDSVARVFIDKSLRAR
jgi:hypothetical protein